MNLALSSSHISLLNQNPINNEIKSSSEDTQMSSSPETHIHKHIQPTLSLIHDSKTLNTYHTHSESSLIIKQYGKSILRLLKMQDHSIPLSFLSKQPFLSPCTRSKLLMHILSLLKEHHFTNTRTYFLTVYIIDMFSYRNEFTICQGELELITLCSLYLASKMENTITMSYSFIENVINEGKYTKYDFICKEKEILSVLDFELVVTTCYDYVEMFLCDFGENNEEFIKGYMKKDFGLFRRICVFLCKLVSLWEDVSCYYQETIAICVLVVGYDLYRTIKEKNSSHKVNVFLHDWINFILNQNATCKHHLKYIYDKLVHMYDINMNGGFGKGLELIFENNE